MLAYGLIRYWWVRPKMPDPLIIENYDPLKSTVISSEMPPSDGPQYEKEEWVRIPASVAGNDPVQRSVIEIEKSVKEGKDMIMVETEIAGQVYYHYIFHGWLLQENTMFYGGIGFFSSYFFPRSWWIYVPATICSILHSWLYFRVYKYDRLSQYKVYDDDRHPVSNLVTAGVLGQRPDHFHFILKKEKTIFWEIVSETVLYSSVISTLFSLMKNQERVMGSVGRFIPVYPTLTYQSLSKELFASAYKSGYFMPVELMPHATGGFLPSDIPRVSGWFDMPYFNFRLKPMKYDLAIIVCMIGGYFVYKAFEHFFGYKGEEEDGLGREWSGNEALEKAAMERPLNPYWVEINNDNYAVILGQQFSGGKGEEQDEITRIANQTPFGYVRAGYTENHYGTFM